MREMSKDLNISRERIQFIVKMNLKKISYKLCRGNHLIEAMKAKRLVNARKILRLVRACRLQNVLFMDEKIFTIQRGHNHQNDRQLLGKGFQKLPAENFITRNHFPSSVMVWACICSPGLTQLVFIKKNIKINAAIYQQSIFRNVLHPCVTRNFNEKKYVLHSARTTISLCKELFLGFGHLVHPTSMQ